MEFSIDLRFSFPPLLNLTVFFLFLSSQDGNSWAIQDGTNHILLYPILKLQISFLIIAILPLLLFLLTPIRISLKVNRPIIHSCRELSVMLAISVGASIILAPHLFLVTYLCLIILSLCYVALASLFKRCFNWFRHTVITSIGNWFRQTVIISIDKIFNKNQVSIDKIFNKNQEMEEPAPPPQDEENIQVVVN